MPEVVKNTGHRVCENSLLGVQRLQSKKISLINLSLRHGYHRFAAVVRRKLTVIQNFYTYWVSLTAWLIYTISYIILIVAINGMIIIVYLDCQGVMTPSSGPPINTSFFRRMKFALNFELFDDWMILSINGRYLE